MELPTFKYINLLNQDALYHLFNRFDGTRRQDPDMDHAFLIAYAAAADQLMTPKT